LKRDFHVISSEAKNLLTRKTNR